MSGAAAVDSTSVYVLAADATQHASDVKHVTWQDQVSFWSASRDATTRQFHVLPNDDGNLGSGWTLAGHQAFVNFVLFHPSLPLLDGEAAIITGSNDRHIIVWSIDHGGIEAVLDAHSDGVRCGVLAPAGGEAQRFCPQGSFVTGGWDKVCVVWDGVSGKPRNTYVGHTNSVLCLAVPKGSTSVVLSGSGDKSVHAWDVNTAKLLHAFTGHTDSVQSLVCMDDDRFVSSGNDGMAVVWSLSCRVAIHTFHAHGSLVFSLAYHAPSGLLFSASDDHSVKVWRDVCNPSSPNAGPLQVIPHPCVVWSVAVQDETGDVVTGGGDGVVRVWSRDDRRMAPVEKLELLQAALASRTIDVKEASGAASAAIPNVESLATVDQMHHVSGTHEGERRFFRNEGLVEVYLWTQGSWSKIGTVVAGPDRAPYTGAPLPREKKLYKGREVDYLFDVEIEGQYLKLPYNRGQNIFDAAQDFIHEYGHLGVSQESKEAIVQHILKLIDPQDAALLGAGSSVATGGASAPPDTVVFSEFAREAEELRRKAGGSSGNVPQSWGEAKKLLEDTGADVAFSTFAQEGKALLSQHHGGSASGSQESGYAATPSSSSSSLSPHVFRVFNVNGAKDKLTEFVGSTDYSPLLDQIANVVSSERDTRPSASQVEEIVCGLVSLLITLEPGRTFPAVDAMRVAAAQPDLAMGITDLAGDSLSAVWTNGARSAGSGGDATTVDVDRVVALRLLANLTSHTNTHAELLPRVQNFALAGVQEWIGLLRQGARSSAANQRAALLAVLQNVSLVYATFTDAGADEGRSQQVRSSVKALVGCIAEVALLWGLTDPSLVKLLQCCLVLRSCRGSVAVRSSAATYVEQFLGPTLRLVELGSDASLKAVKSALSRAPPEDDLPSAKAE